MRIYAGETVTLPNGKRMTSEDLANSESYRIITEVPTVVEVEEDGTLVWFERLASMKKRYGVTNSDDEQALAEIEESIIEFEANREDSLASIEELANELSEVRGALVELAALMEV